MLDKWGEDTAEDRDEYIAENVFWVPAEARWSQLQAQARQSTVGLTVDQAMAAIERDNPVLKDVLARDYARPALDKQRLGQLIDLVSNILVGDEDARSRDVLGRIYEYFLSQFASAEGKKGGEFYTPRCVVKVLVEMLEPYRGRVYDPCCGSSGMFGTVDRVHPRPHQRQRERRQGPRRHQHLRPGVELHDVAARKNEPRHPGHRGPDRARRQLPQRSAPGPEGRLHPRQPAVQRLGLGRRAAGRRQTLALRRAAEGQRQLRMGAAHGPSPFRPAGSRASYSRTGRCRRTSPARGRSGRT